MGDHEKDGKMTLTNSSNKNLKILEIQSRATTKPTKHGSTLPKTEESGLFLKRLTQMTVKNEK